MLDVWRRFLQKRKPFATEGRFTWRETSRVAAGSRQALDVTHSDWIADPRKNGRNVRMFGMQCGDSRAKSPDRISNNWWRYQSLTSLCPRTARVAARCFVRSDQHIYPPLLFEKRFENVVWFGKVNERPDTTRTVLSARAAGVGEHRKTENELPPPHAHPWPHMRQC
jgi:hypothetical protein